MRCSSLLLLPVLSANALSCACENRSWDAIYLERLEQACDFAANADVAAVTMTQNTASLCLLSGAMTTVRAKIEVNIPKKRPGQSGESLRARITRAVHLVLLF